MGAVELLLIMSLNGAQWEMTPEHIPQLCIPVFKGEEKEGKDTDVYCTKVPEVLLHQWLKATTVEV